MQSRIVWSFVAGAFACCAMICARYLRSAHGITTVGASGLLGAGVFWRLGRALDMRTAERGVVPYWLKGGG